MNPPKSRILETPLDQPVELTNEEYQDLVETANDLDINELTSELRQSARYNDLDVLRAVLAVKPNVIDAQDESSGNSALHMAAANNHVDAVLLLIKYGANPILKNASGNTPLHWAAANGHENVVKVLLEQDNVDVLEQNNFGRSSLTEGFSSEQTEVVKLLLEHDSAAEERLVQSHQPGKDASVTHDFVFGNTQLKARELSIASNDKDTILGQANPSDDTTGLGIWAASLVCAQWVVRLRQRFENSTVIELGAGCGIPGLALAVSSTSTTVYLTDFNPKTVENLQHNVDINNLQSSCIATTINWQDPTTYPTERADFCIGSDLVYQTDMVPLLVQTLQKLLKPDGRFFYVSPDTGRQGQEDLWATLEQHMELIHESDASNEFLQNPLASKDDDMCFLHFHELQGAKYKLYEFRAAPRD